MKLWTGIPTQFEFLNLNTSAPPNMEHSNNVIYPSIPVNPTHISYLKGDCANRLKQNRALFWSWIEYAVSNK
jgi:hypothetical protein